jgi:glutaredoxin-related protein
MSTNPFVKRAREALEAAKIPFTYLEYGGYLSRWNDRLAIKLWSGYPTFPQVFVRGTLIGGNSETRELIKTGEIRTLLGDTGTAAVAAASPSQ